MNLFRQSTAALKSPHQQVLSLSGDSLNSLRGETSPVQSFSQVARSRASDRRRNREPGNTLNRAKSIGQLNGSQVLNDTVGGGDRADFYAFSIAPPSRFNLSLSRLKSNANVQLFNGQGQTLVQSNQRGNATKTIGAVLNPGTYYVRVHAQGDRTRYRLSLTAVPESVPTIDSPAGVAPVTSTPASTPTATAPPSPAEWTVMVYMAGNSLERYGVQDFLEMAAVGSKQNVNIVVQFDRTATQNLVDVREDDSQYGNWTDTRRGLVRAGETPGLNWGTSIGEVDMGQASTLRDFASWGMTNYQAKNYALVLWGHGDGLEVSLDDSSQNGISGQELSNVLATLPDRVDLVGADSCLMGMTEFAYEIRNGADVFVSSQELEPKQGWYYTSFLQDLTSTPTLTAAQLGSTIVTRYGQYSATVANTIEETLSAVNLSALREGVANNLTTALNQFAATMILYGTSYDHYVVDWYRDAQSDWFGRDELGLDRRFVDYRDVGNLFTRIARNWDVSSRVWSAATNVLTVYSSAVINNYSSVPDRATGLSIYWSNAGVRPSASFSNPNQSFAVNTLWDDWLGA